MAFIGNNVGGFQQSYRRPQTSADSNVRPTLGSGGGSFGSSGGSGSTTAQSTGGGGYTNLMQYLGANQDTGAATGAGAGSMVRLDYNQAVADQNAYADSANKAIDAAGAKTNVDQSVLDKINAGASGVDQGVMDQINSGKMSEVPIIDYTGPGGEVGVNYSGPMSAAEADPTARATSLKSDAKLAGSADNLNSFDGTQELLDRAFANPNYSAGERGLDAFLSRGTSGGQAALAKVGGLGAAGKASADKIEASAADKIKGYDANAIKTNKIYTDAINAAKSKVSDTRNSYQDALGKYQAEQAAKRAAEEEAQRKAAAAPTIQDRIEEAPQKAAEVVADSGYMPVFGNPNWGGALFDAVSTNTGGPSQWDVVTDVSSPLNKAVKDVGSYIPNRKLFAHGGRVTGYEKIGAMLSGRNKRGC